MIDGAFAGQTVVVTGAARGLGLAIARRFAASSARVVVADLDPPAGRAAAEALRGEGADVAFEVLDVRHGEHCEALVARLVEERGAIDVWVNNAGLWYEAPAEILPRAWWDESMAVLLSGAFYCAQAAGRHMLARRRGVIVNVASVDGLQPVEGHVAYSVAKAGVIMLTQALGIEWAGRGVRVVGVAPGVLAGGWLERDAGEGTALADLYRRRTPMRRLGSPEECAEAVLYLAGPEATYITAETLPVDGGWTAYQLF